MSRRTYTYGEKELIYDSLFDQIAIDLDREWDNIEHMHKYLLDRSMLKTSLAIKKYPLMTIDAANQLQEKKPKTHGEHNILSYFD